MYWGNSQDDSRIFVKSSTGPGTSVTGCYVIATVRCQRHQSCSHPSCKDDELVIRPWEEERRTDQMEIECDGPGLNDSCLDDLSDNTPNNLAWSHKRLCQANWSSVS